jgi:PAS domain S-box-containing protein
VNGDVVSVTLGQDIIGRKKAKGELNRIAQVLRLLIDTANAPIFGIDKVGRVNEWNLKAAEIMGYTSDEVMGRDLVEDFISPGYRVQVKGVLNNALQGRNTANFEFPLFTKSQERVDVLLNATTRRDAGGDIEGVVILGQDLTDRKKAALEQTRVAQGLRLVIDTANEPIFGIDKDGRVNEWNLEAAEIVGYKSDEVMGRDLVEDLITPEYRVQIQEALDDALQGRETADIEFPLFTKSQERVDVLLNATTRRDANGVVTGMVVVGQDLTDRKKAEGELNREAQDLRLLIDNANAPIFGIDNHGRVNEWNLKAAEIMGYRSDEVMGRDLVADFITPEYKMAVAEVLDNALQGRDTSSFEFPLFTKKGGRVEVLLNATPRRDVNGAITGVVGVGQDITDRKKAEGELKRVAQDLRLVIDTANAPIFGIDKDGRVNEWNL